MLRIAATLIAATFMSTAAFADTAALVKDCDGCHGDNGASRWDDMPTIAGISVVVHSDYLTAYQGKERPCPKSKYRQGDTKRAETDMCAVAKKLSEDDIKALAEHYAAKTFVPAKQPFDAAKAATGKALHKKDCEKCHTGGGKNADEDAGILAGQQKGYLKAAFDDFSSGKRPQDKSMKKKFVNLKPDDVTALIEFYASAR
jgi:cytochrome subunit of sulfide dehydrogenase